VDGRVKESSHTWFGELRAGEQVSIGDGSVRLRVEEKSGQRARIRLDFAKPTTVQKVTPGVAALARLGVK
jgi:pyruvate kinase